MLEIFTDVFTDQLHHDLIIDEDFQRLYVTVLLETWRINTLDFFPYQKSHTPEHTVIMTSVYYIAKRALENEPLFLGWNESSRFFQPPRDS